MKKILVALLALGVAFSLYSLAVVMAVVMEAGTAPAIPLVRRMFRGPLRGQVQNQSILM